MFILFSLQQLLVSAGDQQRLQSILSSVGSRSTVLTLIQEAKAQSEVSEIEKTGRVHPCVRRTESLCCSPETTTLLIDDTSVQNKKFRVWGLKKKKTKENKKSWTRLSDWTEQKTQEDWTAATSVLRHVPQALEDLGEPFSQVPCGKFSSSFWSVSIACSLLQKLACVEFFSARLVF